MRCHKFVTQNLRIKVWGVQITDYRGAQVASLRVRNEIR